METIAIVDFEEKNLENCRRMLQPVQDKFNICYLQYPEQALELIDQYKVAVLISELDMPVMTGEELFAMYEMLSPDTVKIAMSSAKDIPATLKCINEAGVFKLIIKPLLLAEDITRPMTSAVEYYEMRRKEEERQLDLQQEIEKLDAKYEKLYKELKQKQDSYGGIYQTILAVIKANLSQCWERLTQEEKGRLAHFFDDVFREFAKCYIFESRNYIFYANYLKNLYHRKEQGREFYLKNKTGGDLPQCILSQAVYGIFLLGYLSRNILEKYRCMVVLAKEGHFYVLKFFCDYKKPEFESDPVYREQNPYMQEVLHEVTYRILSALSFKTVKGIVDNPFTAKIYFNITSEGI